MCVFDTRIERAVHRLLASFRGSAVTGLAARSGSHSLWASAGTHLHTFDTRQVTGLLSPFFVVGNSLVCSLV